VMSQATGIDGRCLPCGLRLAVSVLNETPVFVNFRERELHSPQIRTCSG